jgi:hypothetical protein
MYSRAVLQRFLSATFGVFVLGIWYPEFYGHGMFGSLLASIIFNTRLSLEQVREQHPIGSIWPPRRTLIDNLFDI